MRAFGPHRRHRSRRSRRAPRARAAQHRHRRHAHPARLDPRRATRCCRPCSAASGRASTGPGFATKRDASRAWSAWGRGSRPVALGGGRPGALVMLGCSPSPIFSLKVGETGVGRPRQDRAAHAAYDELVDGRRSPGRPYPDRGARHARAPRQRVSPTLAGVAGITPPTLPAGANGHASAGMSDIIAIPTAADREQRHASPRCAPCSSR